MKTHEIKMPKLGESITEGTIISWFVKVGDEVDEDDILFEVTTAKVNAEIPSPVQGKVHEILFNEGDTVSVGTVVMLMQLNEEKKEEPIDIVSDTLATTAAVSQEERWYSPLALSLAGEAHLATDELANIQGSGYLGRLTKKDIQNYIGSKLSAKVEPVEIPKISTVEDKKRLFSEGVLPKQVSKQIKEEVSLLTKSEDQIVDMDSVRRIIADHMVMSKRTSAHVTTFIEVDVTKLVEWRKQNKETFLKHEGVALTYMPFIVEAATKALMAYPQINASVDGYRMILKKHINIGVAVALDNGNLIVPVIHDADNMSISGLAKTIERLARNARINKLNVDDVQGGTFTITNFGTFKNSMGTPIINQPQVAILGVGYIKKKPAVLETAEGDVIAIRQKMVLSLSYDHRIVNGTLGGKFLLCIANYLENRF